MNVGNKGAYNEVIATAWLLRNGFYVFRNMSSHGPVDLIAMKDSQVVLIDVKAGIMQGDKRLSSYLDEKQVTLGVKVLTVYHDGICILAEPRLSRRKSISGEKDCLRCSKTFLTTTPRSRFCSTKCKSAHYSDLARMPAKSILSDLDS